MKKTAALGCIIVVIAISAFTIQHEVPFKVPEGWPAPVYNFEQHPLSAEKIALGRKLFFDPLLSRDNTISCSSCHLPQTGFTHIDHDLSHGIDNRTGFRNSMALINLAWSKDFMWDGRIHNLDVQAIAPVTDHNEMDETIENMVHKLQGNQQYKAMYAAAFDDSMATATRTTEALSQFMLTLVSNNSKYDKIMRKEPGVHFSEYEAMGYELFKTNCASCHREPLFCDNAFENNGLPVDVALNDRGLAKITNNEKDAGRFKVPTLRNIEVTYPYMHDGRFRNLQMVLFHYTNGIAADANISPQLKRHISLDENEKRNLIAFLKTLTDEQFLHNPQNQFIQ